MPNNSSTRSPKTYVYIDGFNLYYGAMNRRSRGRKWLDLQSWLNKLLPGYEVAKIKFFTARVTGKFDAEKPLRQDFYLRALRTLPNVEIIEGSFLNKQRKIQITQDVFITGVIPEEKGTDVNLATHLVNDAHRGRFEVGVIVSNDSDLSEAVRIVTKEVNLNVGIVNPCIGRRFSKQLTKDASFKRQVRDGALLSSQFSASLKDNVGSFSKPAAW